MASFHYRPRAVHSAQRMPWTPASVPVRRMRGVASDPLPSTGFRFVCYGLPGFRAFPSAADMLDPGGGGRAPVDQLAVDYALSRICSKALF